MCRAVFPLLMESSDYIMCLPDLSGESIPPQLLRDLLRDFISATWGALFITSKNVIVELLGFP
jgi:hypothetical protein